MSIDTTLQMALDARCSCHDRLSVRLGLTQHRGGNLDDFDETRIGLDHLAFAVQDGDDLDSWAARLADAAVNFSPIVPANSIPGAFVLVLRDPDNIQLELFADHPRPRADNTNRPRPGGPRAIALTGVEEIAAPHDRRPRQHHFRPTGTTNTSPLPADTTTIVAPNIAIGALMSLRLLTTSSTTPRSTPTT